MTEKIFDSVFLKKIQSIVINTRMPLLEGGSGNRKSKAKGNSVEFSDFKEYTPGDDFRRIDWNAYGRSDRLYIRLSMEEREAMFNIFIDASKSMAFGGKDILSLKIAAVLSCIGLNSLDRVCINAMNGKEIYSSQNVAGNAAFGKCINFLENISFSGGTDIGSCVKGKDFPRKGISIIISDFFTSAGIQDAVKYLMYKRQEVMLVHVLSDEELTPNLEGCIKLLDSETGCVKEVIISSLLLKKYSEKLKNFINEIKECCAKTGASYVLVSGGEPIEKVILHDFKNSGIII
ncbi:MAG: DUF58 domain-containing protein [Clostridiales bacterium]|nr:DUF58 domain-containing protein [Clostridiales bacterium]